MTHTDTPIATGPLAPLAKDERFLEEMAATEAILLPLIAPLAEGLRRTKALADKAAALIHADEIASAHAISADDPYLGFPRLNDLFNAAWEVAALAEEYERPRETDDHPREEPVGA
jgi:hypothetical protein